MGRISVLNRLLQGSWEHLRQAPPTSAGEAVMGDSDRQGNRMGAPLGLFPDLTDSGASSRVVDAALAV